MVRFRTTCCAEAMAALCLVVQTHREELRQSPSRIRAFMNDRVPELSFERFMLTSVLESPRFFSALRGMYVQRMDLDALEQELREELGFDKTTASWIVECWGAALQCPPSIRNDREFACPSCQKLGTAQPYWAEKAVICPQCNSRLRFSRSLVPTLTRPGWKQKRVESDDWQLINHEGSSRGSVKHQILKILGDDRLSQIEIAETIGLDDIVQALRMPAFVALDHVRIQHKGLIRSILVESILRAYFPDGELRFAPELPAKLTELMRKDRSIIQDDVIGALAAIDGSQWLVFSTGAIHVINPESSWSLSYENIASQDMQLPSDVTAIVFAGARSLSVRGFGVSRRIIKVVLEILGRCAQQQRQLEWRRLR